MDVEPADDAETQAPQQSLGPSVLGLLVASLVAAITFVHFHGGVFCSLQRSRGANIDHALGLSFASGLVGSLLLLLARGRPRLRATVLLTAAVVLSSAIVLVALDSATYSGGRSCGFITSTETTINERVYYLYVFWGAPVVLLLWSASPGLGSTLRGSASSNAPTAGSRPSRRPRGTISRLGLLAATIALAAWAVAESGAPPRTKLPRATHVFGEPNHDHVDGKVHYNRVPPAGGPHNDVWLNCGVYTSPVRNENAVHSLEHGAVWITYSPRLPGAAITSLRRFVRSHYVTKERYLILSPFPGLGGTVVASAWGAQLRLRGAADPRLADFVAHFARGDQGGEPGGPCTGGTGSPSG